MRLLTVRCADWDRSRAQEERRRQGPEILGISAEKPAVGGKGEGGQPRRVRACEGAGNPLKTTSRIHSGRGGMPA
eukprot:6171224-Pyramimonas_sp.AAC.1